MRVLTSDTLKDFLQQAGGQYRVLAPVVYTDGTVALGGLDEGPVDFLSGQLSGKTTAAFFPPEETLFSFEAGAVRPVLGPGKPLLVLGLSAADADALEFIDRFYANQFKDVTYLQRRANSVVAVVSGKVNGGFERIAGKNCDLEFTFDGTKFFVSAYTARGEALAGLVKDQTADVAGFDAMKRQSLVLGHETKAILDHASKLICDGKVTDDFWKTIADSCIECGSCVYSCPTCTCFDVYDVGTADCGVRKRCWDTCVLGGYTREASGHNPRNEAERSRRRVSHKLAADVQRWGHISCMACGRCDSNCPTGIGILAVSRKIVEKFN
ncbi:MAG: hypothetical protein A2583_14635 [Bdellovibrionales bacterium RIFOXYD1_FULL_53_11]|nr:MAG: hypothetical protein A2583_14635 [Bdellovibrionales bacterium RIFOXYD1_FULL_53_11]